MNWTFHNIRGTREAVKAQIAKETMPESAKAFVIAQIDDEPNAIAFIVHGYCQKSGSSSGVQSKRNINLTVEAIRV